MCYSASTFDDCRELIRERKYLEAVNLLETYLTNDGVRVTDAYAWLGLLYYYLRNFADAERNLKLAVELNSNHNEARALLACCLLRRGSNEEVFDEMDAATSGLNESQFVSSMLRWADAALESKNYEVAVNAYIDILEVHPENLDALAGLSRLYAAIPIARLRNGMEGVKLATKACELSSWNDWICLSCLAAAYAESNDFDNAVRFAKIAVDYAPENEKQERLARLHLYISGTPYRLQN